MGSPSDVPCRRACECEPHGSGPEGASAGGDRPSQHGGEASVVPFVAPDGPVHGDGTAKSGNYSRPLAGVSARGGIAFQRAPVTWLEEPTTGRVQWTPVGSRPHRAQPHFRDYARVRRAPPTPP